MALLPTQEWWVRAGGNELNGGGFDDNVPSAGTNYADQDAHQIAFTDLATSGAGSFSLTSAAAGFTSAMVGNIIRIASGTNFVAGYYLVYSFTSSTTVGLDRSATPSGAGSGGVGRLGGAHPDLRNYASGGNATQPVVTTPLAAGHIIHLRGAGSDNPSTADYTQSGYYEFPSGNGTVGYVRLRGYNGRPMILTGSDPLIGYNAFFWSFESVKFKAGGATSHDDLFEQFDAARFYDCIYDQAGFDVALYASPATTGVIAIDNLFYNTGSTSAGTRAVFKGLRETYKANLFVGNLFHNTRGPAIDATSAGVNAGGLMLARNIFSRCHSTASAVHIQTANGAFSYAVFGNVFDANAADGLAINNAADLRFLAVFNNIFSNNGGWGCLFGIGTIDENDARSGLCDFNAYYNNTDGTISNRSQGAHDVILTGTPYTDAVNGDFSLNNTAGAGADLRAVAAPTSIGLGFTANYLDIGAAQHQDTGGSTGPVARAVIVQTATQY